MQWDYHGDLVTDSGAAAIAAVIIVIMAPAPAPTVAATSSGPRTETAVMTEAAQAAT
jgi:hypothetical protein